MKTCNGRTEKLHNEQISWFVLFSIYIYNDEIKEDMIGGHEARMIEINACWEILGSLKGGEFRGAVSFSRKTLYHEVS
jgi:hypothetical protein